MINTERKQLQLDVPIVPVLVIDHLEQAAPLAAALKAAGLSAVEVTFRTALAAQAIAAIKSTVSDLLVGAGTVISRAHVEDALGAGSDFIVSPGMTPDLYRAFDDVDLPVIPAIATPSEALLALQNGYLQQKFFPAGSMGGVDTLAAISGPLPDIRFMPSGGVNFSTMPTYLALKNVFAVGGSWMIDQASVQKNDWESVTRFAASRI